MLMIPYFLSAGVHLLRDLTAARDALGRLHPGVRFLLGTAPGAAPAARRAWWPQRIAELEQGETAGSIASSDCICISIAPGGRLPLQWRLVGS